MTRTLKTSTRPRAVPRGRGHARVHARRRAARERLYSRRRGPLQRLPPSAPHLPRLPGSVSFRGGRVPAKRKPPARASEPGRSESRGHVAGVSVEGRRGREPVQSVDGRRGEGSAVGCARVPGVRESNGDACGTGEPGASSDPDPCWSVLLVKVRPVVVESQEWKGKRFERAFGCASRFRWRNICISKHSFRWRRISLKRQSCIESPIVMAV